MRTPEHAPDDTTQPQPPLQSTRPEHTRNRPHQTHRRRAEIARHSPPRKTPHSSGINRSQPPHATTHGKARIALAMNRSAPPPATEVTGRLHAATPVREVSARARCGHRKGTASGRNESVVTTAAVRPVERKQRKRRESVVPHASTRSDGPIARGNPSARSECTRPVRAVVAAFGSLPPLWEKRKRSRASSLRSVVGLRWLSSGSLGCAGGDGGEGFVGEEAGGCGGRCARRGVSEARATQSRKGRDTNFHPPPGTRISHPAQAPQTQQQSAPATTARRRTRRWHHGPHEPPPR